MRRQSGNESPETPVPAAAPEPGGLPAWVEPQLATLVKERFSDPAWIFERKLDGERCLSFRGQSQGTRLLTRNQHDVTGTFPEIAAALDGQRADGFIVDGEIVAFADGQTRFERLQQRLGVVHPDAKLIAGFPVFYYIFDVLYAGGRDARPLPELDRKRLLAEVLSFAGPLRYTEHRVGDGEAFYRSACEQGWEGLIAKRADAPYLAGRTRAWLKFKCLAGQEFVIGGYTDPRGSRQGFGALLVGYYDPDGRFTYAGKVGTGFDAAMLRRLRTALDQLERDTPAFERGNPPHAGVHWVEPRLVGEVAFAEWTDDGLLRQPRFQGLRDDKDAAEVVRETPQ
jgi:bifunctional non-homologous end joining protein LigD